jgi:hypothetical protein
MGANESEIIYSKRWNARYALEKGGGHEMTQHDSSFKSKRSVMRLCELGCVAVTQSSFSSILCHLPDL